MFSDFASLRSQGRPHWSQVTTKMFNGDSIAVVLSGQVLPDIAVRLHNCYISLKQVYDINNSIQFCIRARRIKFLGLAQLSHELLFFSSLNLQSEEMIVGTTHALYLQIVQKQ